MSRSRKAPAAAPQPAIDPQAIIRQDIATNRLNTFGPFGSQRYTTGPDGQNEFRTELSPQLQGLMDRAAGLSMRDSSPLRSIPGFDNLVNAMMSRQLGRFGGSMPGFGGGAQGGAAPGVMRAQGPSAGGPLMMPQMLGGMQGGGGAEMTQPVPDAASALMAMAGQGAPQGGGIGGGLPLMGGRLNQLDGLRGRAWR